MLNPGSKYFLGRTLGLIIRPRVLFRCSCYWLNFKSLLLKSLTEQKEKFTKTKKLQRERRTYRTVPVRYHSARVKFESLNKEFMAWENIWSSSRNYYPFLKDCFLYFLHEPPLLYLCTNVTSKHLYPVHHVIAIMKKENNYWFLCQRVNDKNPSAQGEMFNQRCV